MEKTLGELFDEYAFLFIEYKRQPENNKLIPVINRYRDIISDKIDYLSNNLELNILVNHLLRANREYYISMETILNSGDDWIEEADTLAIAAIKLHQAIETKKKYIRKIDEFMRSDT